MLHLLKIFLISCYIVGSSSNVSSDDFENRIIKGQIVPARNYPYYIFLKLGSRICGGALIGPQIVLTAAHCLQNVDHIDNITAYTVFNNINQKRPNYSVDWFVVHPNFPAQPRYNVGIVKLNEPVLKDNAKPIRLAARPPVNGTEVGIVGYGAWRCNPGTGNCIKPSNRLRFTKTTIVRSYPHPLLVARNIAGRSVCTGDAGGPVFYNNTLVAIISYTQPNCTGLNYFVRVDAQSRVLRPYWQNAGLGVANGESFFDPGIGRSEHDNESEENDSEEHHEVPDVE